jgi:hypothetical protein
VNCGQQKNVLPSGMATIYGIASRAVPNQGALRYGYKTMGSGAHWDITAPYYHQIDLPPPGSPQQ